MGRQRPLRAGRIFLHAGRVNGMMTLKELLDLVKAGATYLEIMAACKTPEERRAATKILLHTERETWKEQTG